MRVINYNRKRYRHALEDFAHENKQLALRKTTPLSFVGDDELLAFELCHQWRDRYARIIEESPANVLSVGGLVSIGNLSANSTEADILRILRRETKLPRDQLPVIEKQSHTLLRILTEKTTFTARIDNTKCRNCPYFGHVAIFCPFPKDPRPAKIQWKDDPSSKTRWNKQRKINKKANKSKPKQ